MYTKLVMLLSVLIPVLGAQAGEVIELERMVVTAKKKSDTTEIESKSLRTHKVVDLSEILSDEMVEASMIRKAPVGPESSRQSAG
jgi:iron complex outermembrane receptor protein